MARRKRSKTKRAAPAAIVVRAPAPVARRRRSSSPRVIVGRVRRRRGGVGGGGTSRIISDAVTVTAGAALGYLRSSEKIPDRVMGVDTSFAAGLALSLVPFVLKGKVGRYIGDAGAGVGAVAAYRLSLGTKLYVKPGESAGFEDDEDY